jgi:hypothetical protein
MNDYRSVLPTIHDFFIRNPDITLGFLVTYRVYRQYHIRQQ